MSHYDTLGVPKDADAEAIKRAYRKRAQAEHPDKGGDVQKFQALQKAYDTLSDAERRARYDAGGGDEPGQSLHQLAVNGVVQMVLAALEGQDLKHHNVIEQVKASVAAKIRQLEEGMKGLRKKIKRLEDARVRFKRVKPGDNLLTLAVASTIRQHESMIEKLKGDTRLGEEMLVVLADYSYECEIVTPEHTAWKASPFFKELGV